MKISEFKNLVSPSEIPREPALPKLSEKELQTQLNEGVRDKLPRVLMGLGCFYLLFAFYTAAVHYKTWSAVFPMVRLALCTAALAFGGGHVCRRWPVPTRYVQYVCFFIAGLILTNCWLHFFLFESPDHTATLMLLIMGAAFFMPVFDWFLVIVAATVLVWGIEAVGRGIEWFYSGFGLLASTLFGLVLNRIIISREKERAYLVYMLADRRKHLHDFVVRTSAAEERAQKIAEATFEAILFHDAGRIIDANEAALDMFGYTLQEIQAKEILDLFAPDSHQLVANQLRFGTVQSNTVSGLRKDRTEFMIEIFNKTIPMQDGPLLVIAVRDIGHQREAQLALAREKKELENQFSRQMAITQLDGAGEQAESPQMMLDRITRTATEMLPASLGACVLFWKANAGIFQVGSIYPTSGNIKPGMEVPATMNSAHAFILESGEPMVLSSLSGDSMGIRQSFPGLPIQACAGVPMLSNGQIIGILYAFDKLSRQYRSEDLEFMKTMASRAGIIIGKTQLIHQLRIANQNLQTQHAQLQQSISELEAARQTAEEANQNMRFKQEELQETITELERAKELAESAARAKSEFLSTISHELRTPLNGVLGMAEMLRVSELGQHQSSVDMLCESARRLQRIIEHLLNFADARDERLKMKKEALDPAAVGRSVVEEFSAAAQAKGVRLTFQAPGGSETLWGDPDKVQEVLRQLVDNAVKFTQQGQVNVACLVRDSENGQGHLRFVVRDTGPGIPESVQGKLFGLFNPGDGGTNRRHEGLGLGLALAKQLVKLMNGEIDFTSKPGQGSEFWFEVPCQSAAVAPAQAGEYALVPAGKKGLVQGLPANARVLVVDGEPEHRDQLLAKLKALHLQPLAVQNSYEVIPAIQREKVLYDPVQAVILDASVSVEEVVVLVEAIHADHGSAGMPLVLMLRPGQTIDEAAWRRAGVTGWFFKPVLSRKLAECLGVRV